MDCLWQKIIIDFIIIIIIIIIIIFFLIIQNFVHRFKKNRLFTDSRI